jgi:hypothetical protein
MNQNERINFIDTDVCAHLVKEAVFILKKTLFDFYNRKLVDLPTTIEELASLNLTILGSFSHTLLHDFEKRVDGKAKYDDLIDMLAKTLKDGEVIFERMYSD